MRAFITSGTGFLGGRVVGQLRARSDQVVALVRSPRRAARLGELGCELVEGDLSSQEPLARAMSGCDAVFHAAAVYRIGILPREAETMRAANVEGMAAVLDAAAAADVTRVVYVSTNNVFGNTRGRVVDDTYERPPGEWLSAYDESKYLAHQLARERSAQGAPIVIVQPGGIYGPGDHTQMGALLARAAQVSPTCSAARSPRSDRRSRRPSQSRGGGRESFPSRRRSSDSLLPSDRCSARTSARSCAPLQASRTGGGTTGRAESSATRRVTSRAGFARVSPNATGERRAR